MPPTSARPGVVDDLSQPLTPTWNVTHGGGIAAVMAGGVLATRDGTCVRALHAATGAELWVREIGTNLACGPGPDAVALGRPLDDLVCLDGEPDDRRVTVLDPAGAVVGTRRLGAVHDPRAGRAAHAPMVRPGADRTIAVVHLADSLDVTVPVPDVVPTDETLRALYEAGFGDPTLRVEDALTGEPLAELTAPLRTEDLDACGRRPGDDGELRLRPHLSVVTSPSLTVLRVCGASVAVAHGRARLEPQEPGVEPLPVDDDPDGPALVTVHDEGTGPASLLTATSGTERLWAVPVYALSSVLARVAGTVVVTDGAEVTSIDARTGAALWKLDDLLVLGGDGTDEWITGVVTDGARLLLGIASPAPRHRLVALDVRDGSTLWERTDDLEVELLAAADGHPLLVSPARTTTYGLGRTG